MYNQEVENIINLLKQAQDELKAIQEKTEFTTLYELFTSDTLGIDAEKTEAGDIVVNADEMNILFVFDDTENLVGVVRQQNNGDDEPGDEYLLWESFEDGLESLNKVGEFVKQNNGSYEIVDNPDTRLGGKSCKLTVTGSGSRAAYLFVDREGVLPDKALYSCDYYIPSEVVPGSWWSLMQWKVTVGGSTSKSVPQFSFDVSRTGLSIYYRPDASASIKKRFMITGIELPRDKWFELSAEYECNPDKGLVRFRIDEEKIIEITDLPTLPEGERLLWSVNNYTDNISPNPCSIYVDNMAVWH